MCTSDCLSTWNVSAAEVEKVARDGASCARRKANYCDIDNQEMLYWIAEVKIIIA
jgi:hypothetical protein